LFSNWSVRRRLTVAALLSTLCGYSFAAVLITPVAHTLLTGYQTEEAARSARRVTFTVQRTPMDQLRPVAGTESVDLIQVVDDHGRVRQASQRLVGLPPLTTDRNAERSAGDGTRLDTTTCTTRVPGEKCLITVGYKVLVDGQPWFVYAYTDTLPWYVSPAYVLIMLAGVLLFSAVSAYVTAVTVGRALEPVKAIKTELAEITATDLGRRVPPSAHDDEIHDLARTINQTLDRLESAVEQERRFASDASHDLRTPLTAMRAQVEEAMLHPEEGDWQRTGAALLSLARLDAGAPTAREPVDLATLVEEELRLRPRAKQVDLRLERGVTVIGDRLRLTRLLTNLLDNAERHAESAITVTTRRQDGQAVLEVADDGAGIAADLRELVFRRFTRLDAARNRDAGGTGLGLPIAREIARAHEGTLRVEESEIGARFVLRIPRASS
jgi:signal transduction histidine kinase